VHVPFGIGAGRRLYYGWLLVVTLGITETITWGVLYYAFAVLIRPMGAELGWSLGAISGAFSLALLFNGLTAIAVGRWLDHHGPRLLMTAGSCLGVVLVVVWSRITDLGLFYVLWAAIGLVMATVLYEPAFATVVLWFERRRARALTAVTLFAGFASTIFLPLTAWLVRLQGWRSALVTLAVILAVGTILPHALLLRRRPEDLGLRIDGEPASAATEDVAPLAQAPGLSLGEALRSGSFPWLVAAFCLSTGVSTAVRLQLVPYLVQRGFDAGTAAALTGGIGAMQVLGRLVLGALSERISIRAVAALALGIQPVGLLVLVLARDTAGVVVFVALFGASYGATTLVRPAFVAGLYGRVQYASIAGVLAFATTLAQAVAPLAAGVASDRIGSYDPVVWGLAVVSALAALALLPIRSGPERY
jgi:MFS family permease